MRKKKLGFILALSATVLVSIGQMGMNSIRKEARALETDLWEEVQTVETKQENLNIRAKSAYLMDFESETPIYTLNEKTRLPIASMCKIMTLLLAFDAVKEGTIGMEEEISVSERASSMGGSQVFLEANAKYPVKELIKSIVVCSANDSCVALAERIAGSEDVFVERMNEKAKEIGAYDTLYANCTGLPKEPQYSCAQDVAIILKNLLKHEEYYEFSKVWLDKFAHPKGRYTEITNTNKLVRFYDGCDGGKTGFTNEAGFCLGATAKRNNMRIISVVIGEKSSTDRFEDVKTMFDYAFANYTLSPLVEGEKALDQKLCVNGGKQDSVDVCPARSAYGFMRRNEKVNYTTEVRMGSKKAPLAQGEEVGEIVVYKEGVETERIPLLAMQNVKRANVFDCYKDVARHWNGR